MEYTARTEDDLAVIVGELLGYAGNRKKITLNGDLGAGKTAFVRAFCRCLHVRETVSSPTFAIVNDYSYIDEYGAEQQIHHMDLYRLKNLDEALSIGVEEYLNDEAFCLIEWPELISDLLPGDAIHVRIDILPDGRRKILFS